MAYMKKLIVEDAMTPQPKCAAPKDTVAAAAKLMEKKSIGSLPVCAGAQLVGLITSEDIVKRVVAKNKPPDKIRVEEIMSRKPFTVATGTELTDAMKAMAERGIKRLLVVDGKKLVGVMTDGDVLRVSPNLIEYLYKEVEELKEDVGAAGAADICESCGNYTTDLKVVNGELLCEECRETGTYI